MIDALIRVWLLIWRGPTNVWRYVTGRSQFAFAKAVIVVSICLMVTWWFSEWPDPTYSVLWRMLDVLGTCILVWWAGKRFRDFDRRERAIKRREDGSIYAFASADPRALVGAAAMASFNVMFMAMTLRPGWMAWILWWSGEFVAAQSDGTGKTLKQTARNLVARIKAIRLPSLPRWRPAPTPRPIPV